jgi:hypothetical protein
LIKNNLLKKQIEIYKIPLNLKSYFEIISTQKKKIMLSGSERGF